MNSPAIRFLLLTSIVISLFIFTGCGSSAELQSSVPAPELATARVSATLSEPGQAIISGHNDLQYSVVEQGTSGLTEIGTLLAAQVTCGVFVAEKAAQELDVPLSNVSGAAAYDAAAQRVEVFLDLPGADGEQVLELANNFRQRCPIYTTLQHAAPIEVSVVTN